MKRKPTGGGLFKPDASPLYFLASTSNCHHGIKVHKHMLMAVNEMMTARSLTILKRLMDAGVEVLIDSGVFGAATAHSRAHGITLNDARALPPEQIDGYPELRARYIEIVKTFEHRLWGYIEMDFGDEKQKKKVRAELEAEGLRPIPVFHPATDRAEYFDELVEQYERIAIGSIVRLPLPGRRRLYAGIAKRMEGKPKTWIHLLGMTPHPVLLAYPQASCDSSSWIALAKFAKNEVNTALAPLAEVDNLQHVAGNEAGEGEENTNEKAMQVGALAAQYEERIWRDIAHRFRELETTGL